MARNPRASKRRVGTPGMDAPPVARQMSDEEIEKIRQATEQEVDDFMRRVGYANPAERTDEQGWRWFELGSARGRVGLVASQSD